MENKMNKEMQIFKNEELNLQARAIKNENGSISINAEDTAIGFGWYEERNGKIYPRWRTINNYLKEFGFSQHVAKDDYIPESLFYRLGMKANNKVADKFQNWLAIDVIPTIRKTGGYIPVKEEDTEMEILSKALLIANKTMEMQKERLKNLEVEKNKAIEDKNKLMVR